MPLLALFILIPLIEIGLFIQVGGLIGLWPTLAIVVLTAILGHRLVRSQGARELANLRGAFESLQDPSEPLAHGAMILFSGALLLTPGFFTDAVGFALLIPAVRRRAFAALKSRIKVAEFQMGPGPQHPPRDPRRPDDRVIDGEWTEVEPAKRPTHRPSGWTRQ